MIEAKAFRTFIRAKIHAYPSWKFAAALTKQGFPHHCGSIALRLRENLETAVR
jgi:hypothetical protein